jgi:hypothetical protein
MGTVDEVPDIPDQYRDVPSPMEALEAELRDIGYDLPQLTPEQGRRAVEQTSPEINEMLFEGNPWGEIEDREIAHERMAAGSYNDRHMASLQIELERQFVYLNQPDQDQAHIIRTIHSLETMIQDRAKALGITPPKQE